MDMHAQSDIESEVDLDSEAAFDHDDEQGVPIETMLAQMGFSEEQVNKFSLAQTASQAEAGAEA